MCRSFGIPISESCQTALLYIVLYHIIKISSFAEAPAIIANVSAYLAVFKSCLYGNLKEHRAMTADYSWG